MNTQKTIRVAEWFGGIGAATQALKHLLNTDQLEIVDYVELDKWAVRAYNAINGTNYVPKDINTINVDLYGEIDILIAGWPCQDLSVAGKNLGMIKGDRSNLIFTTINKINEMSIKPKYVLLENVKGLLSKKHENDLNTIKQMFDELGYQWEQVLLNSKYFGVPQSRERVFILLTRKDLLKVSLKHLESRNKVDKVLRDVLDFSLPTHTISLYDMFEYNKDNIVEEKGKLWWKLSDGSLREILKIKEENKTVNVPFTKNFTNNLMATLDGQMPTIMHGSARYVLVSNHIEFTNFITLPRASDGKVVNGYHNRVWSSEKYVGTSTDSATPQIYFKNQMNQYTGKTIKLDLDKLNNQNREEINKVAVLGEFVEKVFATSDFGNKDRLNGVNGVNGTLTSSESTRQQILFQEHSVNQIKNFTGADGQYQTFTHNNGTGNQIIYSDNVERERESSQEHQWQDHSFNQKKDFLGVSGISKTLRAGDCDSENKIIWQDISFNQDKSVFGIDGQSQTLVATSPDFKNKIAYPINKTIHYRKLSSLECWRLMGFKDEAHNNALSNGVSASQLAKQAGNSIVVNVLVEIFKEVV